MDGLLLSLSLAFRGLFIRFLFALFNLINQSVNHIIDRGSSKEIVDVYNDRSFILNKQTEH